MSKSEAGSVREPILFKVFGSGQAILSDRGKPHRYGPCSRYGKAMRDDGSAEFCPKDVPARHTLPWPLPAAAAAAGIGLPDGKVRLGNLARHDRHNLLLAQTSRHRLPTPSKRETARQLTNWRAWNERVVLEQPRQGKRKVFPHLADSLRPFQRCLPPSPSVTFAKSVSRPHH